MAARIVDSIENSLFSSIQLIEDRGRFSIVEFNTPSGAAMAEGKPLFQNQNLRDAKVRWAEQVYQFERKELKNPARAAVALFKRLAKVH